MEATWDAFVAHRNHLTERIGDCLHSQSLPRSTSFVACRKFLGGKEIGNGLRERKCVIGSSRARFCCTSQVLGNFWDERKKPKLIVTDIALSNRKVKFCCKSQVDRGDGEGGMFTFVFVLRAKFCCTSQLSSRIIRGSI